MTELDNLNKSETPNLDTLHRLDCTGFYSSINSESLPEWNEGRDEMKSWKEGMEGRKGRKGRKGWKEGTEGRDGRKGWKKGWKKG